MWLGKGRSEWWWYLHCASCRKNAGNKENHFRWSDEGLWSWEPEIYKILEQTGCLPILLQFCISFHEDMNVCSQFDGNTSESFKVRCGVKQGCVLASTLFAIYSAALLQHAFDGKEDGIYLRTRFDWSLFNLKRLKLKWLLTEALIRELLFADGAAIATHGKIKLQRLISCLAEACDLCGLTISVKKTEVIGQGTNSPPETKLDGESLKTVDKFVYLGSTITSTLSLDEELTSRIGKTTAALKKLVKRAWENGRLRIKTKVLIYQTYILSTLLYGCETWTLHAARERRLNNFHMRCSRNILMKN